MPLWAIVALLGAGAGVGLFEPGRFSYAFGAATLYVFLPPLLFEGAWNLDARIMLAQWRPIFVLAVPGVVITTAIVASAVALSGFPVFPALIIGAAVSATDPIAVVAIFRRLPVPAPLSTIVQSEALLNDAMAVVVYRAVLFMGAVTFGASAAFVVVTSALVSVGAGVLVGFLLANVIAHLIVRRNAAAVQTVATAGGAYASYFGAEALHASGIFAVIAFGIALREIERRSISVQVADDVGRLWDIGARCANGCIFFLTGAAIELTRLADQPFAAGAAIGGVLIARFVLSYLLTPLALGRTVHRLWLDVVLAAGARGALSLALVLALPLSVGLRSQIIDVTFAVVLATLLSSALLVPRTIKAFGLGIHPYG